MGYSSNSTTTSTNVDPTVVAQILGATTDTSQISIVNGNGLDYVSTTPALIINNDSNLHVTASSATTVGAGTGANVDFRGSVEPDGMPVPLTVYTAGFDKVVLNGGADFAQSFGTHDTIRSGGGTDTLVGGTSATKLVGGGQSQIQGSTDGGDTIVGGLKASSQDTIVSGGHSLITATQGSNVITGGVGDTIRAGTSQDVITGGAHSTISGGQGATIFSGGNSLLRGGQDNSYTLKTGDTLQGGQGNNSVVLNGGVSAEIDGGKGALDVTLNPGGGTDTLFGGSGGLTVHLGAGFGRVVSNELDANDPTVHHLTFSNGQQLVTGGVTIEFANGKTYHGPS